MNWFDLTVLAVLAASVGFAVVRGALREVGTLLVLGLAGVGAWSALPALQAMTRTADSLLWTGVIAGLSVLVLFLLGYALMHLALARLKVAGAARAADRILGGAFGFARGLVLVGLGYLALTYLSPVDERGVVASAATRPLAQGIAEIFEGLAPESTRLDRPGPAPATGDDSDAAAEGYGRAERAALAEIVTTVTTTGAADEQAGPAPDSAVPSDTDVIAAILQESAPE